MHTEFIQYKNDIIMEGFVAYDRQLAHGRTQPVVLIVHDWSGCREFAEDKARYFGSLGYIGFAVDLYGKGRRGSDTDKSINQKLMTPLLEDRDLIIERLQAAVVRATQFENVDSDRIAAVGFCFGGLCVLDFARAGENISGVVSVHGLLMPPRVISKAKINAKVLALHGYEDKGVTPEALAKFHVEMTERGADWQTHVFGNTMHAFTNPKAHDLEAGLQFSASADARTWPLIENFLSEIFA